MALRSQPRLTQYRGNVLTSAPAVEPVTAAELRTFLRETATGLPDTEANDFIAHVDITGLDPASHYFYRWRRAGTVSRVGEFVTAPRPDQSTSL